LSKQDHAIPLSGEYRECALRRFQEDYAFVAVIERYAESVCLLTKLLDIPENFRKVRNDKATTGTKGSQMPRDFERNWGPYATHDAALHAEANSRLDKALDKFPVCRK
jgi:hypothetical protein